MLPIGVLNVKSASSTLIKPLTRRTLTAKDQIGEIKLKPTRVLIIPDFFTNIALVNHQYPYS